MVGHEAGHNKPLLHGHRRVGLAQQWAEEGSADEEHALSSNHEHAAGSWWQGGTFKALLLLTVALSAAALGSGRRGCSSPGGVAPAGEWPQFLVVGDWGRRGKHNQSEVALAMARKAEAMRVDFVISTGDNFYPSGLLSPADPTFHESFTAIYHQPSLQVPWHVVLGNHDHGESEQPDKPPCTSGEPDCYFSPLHELDSRLLARDARWHCERSFTLPLAGGAVELFFIDTTPMMAEYAAAPWRANRGGVAEQSWEGQLAELGGRLARSPARWKIVVGHHPIRTNHRTWHAWPEMVAHLEPLLAAHGVRAYICGHDHNLQLIHMPSAGYYQVTSGAGSRVGPAFHGAKHSLFQHGGNGFVAVRLSPSTMALEYMGLDSDVPLYRIDVPLAWPP